MTMRASYGGPSLLLQGTRAQTNTSGIYTWVFPVPYQANPIVEVTVEDNTNATWTYNITALSPTSVTVQIVKSVSVTILGISVLGISASPQAWLHLTARP